MIFRQKNEVLTGWLNSLITDSIREKYPEAPWRDRAGIRQTPASTQTHARVLTTASELL